MGREEWINSKADTETVESVSEKDIVRAAVQAIGRDRRDEFRHIVKLYQKWIFALSLMIVRDPSGAEEVAQNAFISAYKNLDIYEIGRPFYPWLATIAIGHAHSWIRRHLRISAREGTELEPSMGNQDAGANVLDTLITNEKGKNLWRLVALLPSGQRTVTLLYYQQELKLEEIAQALGVTVGTVKTLLFRARRTLRKRSGEIICEYADRESEKKP